MHPEFTLHSLLLNTVQRDPRQVAVVDRDRKYTYEDLLRDATRLAGTLERHGIRRGDRVGVYLEKSWEAVVAMFAVAQLGGVFVNINALLKEGQVRHILGNCGIRALIGESDRLQAASFPSVDLAIWRGADPQSIPWCRTALSFPEAVNDGQGAGGRAAAIESDLATIIYTSGSTGLSKGIMVTHHNLVAGAQIVSTYLRNTREDRVLSVLPFSFDYGLNQMTTMVRVGGTLVLQRSLLSGDILRGLRAESITGLAGVPSVWVLLLQAARSLEQRPLAHLRYITNSGGMIPSAHLEQLRRLLPETRIFLMYGLTEAFRSTYLPPEEVDRGPGCIGRAIPDTDIWVVNEKGDEVGPGETGELIHRGPTVALGYWGDEQKTRSVYRPNPLAPPEMRAADTVVYSGDLVKRGEDGFLYYIGRRDEMIKTEGYRVSPQEVEGLLCSLPMIQEAAVFGQKDGAFGQRIVALVAPKGGAATTVEQIRALCAEQAPHYLVPKVIHILPELPKTPTGKIDRSRLKHEYAGDQG